MGGVFREKEQKMEMMELYNNLKNRKKQLRICQYHL